MARQKAAERNGGGRGSAEAVEKRRVARQLNSLLTGGAKPGDKVDGRTEKRRQRLVDELKNGRNGKQLKPIDFVSNVHELLGLGETQASLKKAGVKPKRLELTPEAMEVARRTQAAYGFNLMAWKILGVDLGETEAKAARNEEAPKRKSAKKRASKK